MIVSFIVFCTGLLGIFLFLAWKAPVLTELSEKEDGKNDFILAAKEKLEEGVEKEVKERFEVFLQRFLSCLRRFLGKIEQLTTKWLYTLRRKRKEKDKK